MTDGLQQMDNVRRALVAYYVGLGAPEAARRAANANDMRSLLFDVMEADNVIGRLHKALSEINGFERAHPKFTPAECLDHIGAIARAAVTAPAIAMSASGQDATRLEGEAPPARAEGIAQEPSA